jgi:hypothetical protein
MPEGLGVHGATGFSTMGHAQFSKPAQYNIRVGISIAGSNNGTIGIERRGVPSGCQGRKGKLERLESVGSESLCFGGSWFSRTTYGRARA